MVIKGKLRTIPKVFKGKPKNPAKLSPGEIRQQKERKRCVLLSHRAEARKLERRRMQHATRKELIRRGLPFNACEVRGRRKRDGPTLWEASGAQRAAMEPSYTYDPKLRASRLAGEAEYLQRIALRRQAEREDEEAVRLDDEAAEA